MDIDLNDNFTFALAFADRNWYVLYYQLNYFILEQFEIVIFM